MALPRPRVHAREDINTEETRAAEQILLDGGKSWEGGRVVMHTDNRAVFYGLANGTIRDASMMVCYKPLLLRVILAAGNR